MIKQESLDLTCAQKKTEKDRNPTTTQSGYNAPNIVPLWCVPSRLPLPVPLPETLPTPSEQQTPQELFRIPDVDQHHSHQYWTPQSAYFAEPVPIPAQPSQPEFLIPTSDQHHGGYSPQHRYFAEWYAPPMPPSPALPMAPAPPMALFPSPPESPDSEAPDSSGTAEADSLLDDPEYQAFERDALRAMAERNGGELLGSNPRMRRAVAGSADDDLGGYRHQRERNNRAAKQSRDRRKLREMRSALQVVFLQGRLAAVRRSTQALLNGHACRRCCPR